MADYMIRQIAKMASASLLFIAPMGVMVEVIGSEEASEQGALRMRVVNFKACIEHSKLGKQEQANFEGLKKQMETILEQKERELQEVSAKFNDPDYLDSLSTEAENELKHKLRTLTQEVAQHQNFYMQTLNQTNMRVMQKIADAVEAAAEQVAKEHKYDMVINEELCFFNSPHLEVSKEVITAMDLAFDKENKKGDQTFR